MQTRDPGRIAAGDEIGAGFLNALSEACGLSTGTSASAPLGIQKTAGGMLIRWAGQVFGVYIVVAASTITARSGSTLGSGTATIQTLSGTSTVTLAALSGVPAIEVYSISSTTGGIPSGTYCVALKIASRYIIIAADCGN